MKKIISLLSIFLILVVLVNFGVDCFMGRPVSTEHLNKKIAEVRADIKARFDSLNKRVDSLFSITEEIRADVKDAASSARSNGTKLDSLRSDVKEIKTTTKKIEFNLF